MATPAFALPVINVPNCTEAAVRSAFTPQGGLAADTTTINIPNTGNCSWSSQEMFLTLPAGIGNLSIIGAGDTTSTRGGGSGNTVILDDLQQGSDALWSIAESDTNRTRVIRIAGFTFRRSSGATKNSGFIKIVSLSQVRIDHNTFDANFALMWTMHIWFAKGLFHENIIQNIGGQPNGGGVFSHFTGADSIDGEGDAAWAAATGFGTDSFLFFENNTSSAALSDCDHGAKVVIRFNSVTGDGMFSSHGTGQEATRTRGCRAVEMYGNVLTGTANHFTAGFVTGGPGLLYDNTINGNYSTVMRFYDSRHDTQDFQPPTPTGWGKCGTAPTGVGSNWDQNTDAVTGYACLDQIGRGQGDLLSGSFPTTINNTTGTIAWPHQALEPWYEWNNVMPTNPYSVVKPDITQSDREYFVFTNAFNGSTGVGRGTLAARPVTCGGATGNIKVGYWATDTTTLYQCTSLNTWTQLYRPFAYPHPLAGTTGTPPPGTPSSVTVN